MSHIEIIDSTARDGVQSLWALRLTAPEMLGIASVMDDAGFKVIDLAGLGFWQYYARFLGENPWKRLDLVSRRIRKTPLHVWMRSRGIWDYSSIPKPHEIAKLWISRLAAHGIRRIGFLEEENDFSNIPDLVSHAKANGMSTLVEMIYSVSPYHTPEYYRAKAAEAVRTGIDVIELKDPSGLLTPEATVKFVEAVRDGSEGSVDLEFQAHCTIGLGLLSTLAAIRSGITSVRTCLPPLAEGDSLPSTFSVLSNCRHDGHSYRVNLDAARTISRHFTRIGEVNALPSGVPKEFDGFYYDHQIPGGVQGTLRWQLKQLGSEDRFDDVLREVARIRKELGYPIMVTPTSQFVVAQATINVLDGERYRIINDEVIQKICCESAVRGPGPVDETLMARVRESPQYERIIAEAGRTLDLDQIYSRYGSDMSDDEALCRLSIADEYYEPVRFKEIPDTYDPDGDLFMHLLEKVLQSRRRSVYIRKGNLELSVRR